MCKNKNFGIWCTCVQINETDRLIAGTCNMFNRMIVLSPIHIHVQNIITYNQWLEKRKRKKHDSSSYLLIK